MRKFLCMLVMLLSSTALFALQFAVPEKTQVLTADFTASKGKNVTFTFIWKDGTRKRIVVKASDANYLVNSNSGERYKMPDAGYLFDGLKVLDYVRGNIALLKKDKRKALLQTYALQPPLPPKKYTLKVVNKNDGAEFYINGNLAGFQAYKSKKRASFAKIVTNLAKKDFTFSTEKPCEKFHTLPVALLNDPGSFKNAVVSFKDDKKIPFGKISSVNMDLGKTYIQSHLYPNGYGDSGQTGRNAFDNAEASFLFTVPMRQYSHVWLLCAADNNPAKEPTFTARITRYVPSGQMGGRAYSALGDARIDLSKMETEKVGEVKVGKKVLPLWRVKVPLNMGKVVDLVTHLTGRYGRGAFPFRYLDFELMGTTPLYRTPFGDPRVWPSTAKISSVHVFGAVLEKSGIDVKFLQTTLSKNMFDDTMKKEMKVEYKKVFPGKYTLEWSISDHTGKVRKEDKISLDGEKGVKSIDLDMPKLGWYKIVYTVKDAEKNEELLRHEGSFALMGKDTRKARWDSPYIGWAWGSSHYGDANPDALGMYSKMLGIRRLTGLHLANFRDAKGKRVRWTEKDWEKYHITTLYAERFVQRLYKRYLKRGEQQIIDDLRLFMEKYPNAIQAILLWENSAPFGSYAQAPELYGFKPAPYSEARKKQMQIRKELFKMSQRIIKKHFPQLKIMYGNSLASSELIAEILREKPPKDFTHYWGTEAIQRTAHPEKPFLTFTMMTSNEMNRTAELFGYGHIKTATGPENIARKSDTLGKNRYAQWLVRDMLVQHIFKFAFIAGANSGRGVGNAYDSSFYGGGPGRAPYYYPDPAASATGTLTKVLDQVEFLRMFPTTSNTVYCAEFVRKYDKKFIYVVWTSRGEADLAIKTNSSNVEHIEFHGHSSTPSIWFKNYKVTASTAAQYILTDKKFASVKITGRRIASPKDALPEEFTVAAPVNSTAKWKVELKNIPAVEGKKKPGLNKYLAKKATVKEVNDPEKGKCLALSIATDRKLNDFFHEYMIIRPDKPILIKDELDSIGLWVKGNSGWGQIYFELEDANGIRRISCGTGVHGNSDLADYTGRCAIDYDGAWAFLSMPVTYRSKIRELSTGTVKNIWSGRWGEPAMPCKLTGIYFCAPVKPFFHNIQKYVDQTILIRDISVRTSKKVELPKGDYAVKVLITGNKRSNAVFHKKTVERDWGAEYYLTTKTKQKKWVENGLVVPNFERLARDGINVVCLMGSAVTKSSFPNIKPFVENGGIVVLGYTVLEQAMTRNGSIAAELAGIKKVKALRHTPYTGKKVLEHEVKYLPEMGKKHSFKFKAVYSPFAVELAGAVPLVENCKEKGLYMATIHKVGNGYILFCGRNDQNLLMDLLDYAIQKKAAE